MNPVVDTRQGSNRNDETQSRPHPASCHVTLSRPENTRRIANHFNIGIYISMYMCTYEPFGR